MAFLGLIVAALICYLLFYLAPGLMGMKTGLPLYIVGTSTYGAQGGFVMPGVLMGLLQFGWLAVNGYFAGLLLVLPFGQSRGSSRWRTCVVAAVWIALGAFMGVKGIKYVAKVATFLPLIPLAILVILVVATIGGIGNFSPDALVKATQATSQPTAALSTFGIIALLGTYIVGFFATAGAAGADFGMNNRNAKDVHMGGLVGVALSIVFAGGMALLIVAGAYGSGIVSGGAGLDPTAPHE